MKLLISLIIVLLFVPLFLIHAASDPEVKGKPSGESILFDLVILRPFGIATCALGIAASIVSIPFNIANPDPEYVGKKLLGEPFKFTFIRPLGQIHLEENGIPTMDE
ncbi:MAG: hypothetical protein N2513_08195 [Deltaproteobacteria bacterium]|nr:hypothetical protein [Deltaproteobacteria bacterium]